MPFDGYGTFIRLRSWIVDATNSVKIRADFHDDEDNNFAAGLTNCITKDGQTAITQNIPLNSRRIISLADPIDPQDAATKDYADTKMPLDGSAPITGDVTIKEANPTLVLDGDVGGSNSIEGKIASKMRWLLRLGNGGAETGNNAGSDFDLYRYADDGSLLGQVLNFNRATGLGIVAADPTTGLGIATKQYADATAVNAASSKLPLTGGVISGNLQVNGSLIAVGSNAVFLDAGGSGYLQWNGGGTYTLGGGGTIWHSGNFNPAAVVSSTVTNMRLSHDADYLVTQDFTVHEPLNGGVITGLGAPFSGGTAITFRIKQMQILLNGAWGVVGYA